MLFTYARGSNRSTTVGQVSASTSGTVLTSSASANAKGSYSQITSATPFHAAGIMVHVVKVTNNTSDYLIDLAVGGSGSEQVIINNLLHAPVGFPGSTYFFPISIPSGTRLSARLQGTAASRQAWIFITLTNGHESYSRVATWGADITDSSGLAIDGGGTAHTKGTYAQLTSATDFAIKKLLFVVGNQVQASRAATNFLWDFAVDIGGNKQIMLADIPLHNQSSGNPSPWVLGPYDVILPAASNLYARTQSSVTATASRQFDLVAYGIG